MKLLTGVAMLFLCCSTHLLHAQQTPSKKQPLRLLLGGALDLGGDKVADIYFTNGETQSVRTAQGISAFAGGQLQLTAQPKLFLRSSIGFKYVTTQADNAHIRLTRIPITNSLNYMPTKNLRLGAGVSLHRNIRFKSDGIGQDLKINPAAGPVFEIAYRGVGLSYTAMNYTDEYHKKYAANAIGITFSGVIPGMK